MYSLLGHTPFTLITTKHELGHEYHSSISSLTFYQRNNQVLAVHVIKRLLADAFCHFKDCTETLQVIT